MLTLEVLDLKTSQLVRPVMEHLNGSAATDTFQNINSVSNRIAPVKHLKSRALEI